MNKVKEAARQQPRENVTDAIIPYSPQVRNIFSSPEEYKQSLTSPHLVTVAKAALEPESLVGTFLPGWDSEELAQAGEFPENLHLSGDPRLEVRAGEFLPDCPLPEILIPAPYSVNEGGIFTEIIKNNGKKNMSTNLEIVALAPVIITKRSRGINNDAVSLQLAWKIGQEWKYVNVDRDVISDGRKIVQLSKNGFPVNSVNASQMISYLSSLEAANMGLLPEEYEAHQLGWQGENGSLGFLWGRTLIPSMDQETKATHVSFKGMDEGDEQFADGFHKKGSMDSWMEAVTVASSFPKVMLAFYAAFTATLLGIIGGKNFVLEYAKRTSTGKSVCQRFAASVMGNPDVRENDSVIHTWSGTPIWIRSVCALSNGLPLILDDTKQASNGQSVADTIYMVAAGKDKGRGSLKGTRSTPSFRTVLISSGEVPAISMTNDGGTKGRVISITSLPFDGDGPKEREAVEQISQITNNNYGHALPMFIGWIMKNKHRWNEWKTEYLQLVPAYASSNNVAGRLAENAAAIAITAQLVHEAFEELGYPLPFEIRDPFDGYWEEITNETEDAIGAENCLREVFSWAVSNETSFHGRHRLEEQFDAPVDVPHGGWLGRWDKKTDWEYLAIVPFKLKNWMSINKYNEEEIFRYWKEMGWLLLDQSNKGYAKQIRYAGDKAYLICITRKAIDAL